MTRPPVGRSFCRASTSTATAAAVHIGDLSEIEDEPFGHRGEDGEERGTELRAVVKIDFSLDADDHRIALCAGGGDDVCVPVRVRHNRTVLNIG